MVSGTRPVTILYLTDVHARVEPRAVDFPPILRSLVPPGDRDRLTFGLAAVEQLVVRETEGARGEPVLFINCGDILGIEMVHDREEAGLITLQAMEAIAERAGIEHCYSVVGNHEMDFGVDGFLKLQGAARRFKFLAGNLTIDGAPASAPFEILNVGGLRIALVSLTVDLTQKDAPRADRARLEVAPSIDAATAALIEVRALKAAGEIDLAIGIVHLWEHEDVSVADVEGLDLLLGGHSHVFHNETLGARSVPYGKAGYHAHVLGTVRLLCSEHGVAVDRSWLLPGASDASFVSNVSALFGAAIERIKAAHPEKFREVALLPAPIDGSRRVRSDEAPIGRLVAEMMLETARRASLEWVHFAFINGGNVRQDLQGTLGKVLAADLQAVVPYGNELLLVEATPRVVMRVLYNFIACAKVEPSGFLQFAGIRFRVDAAGDVHDVEIQVGNAGGAATWRPLADVPAVRMATIDFLVRDEGGHHYRFLGDETVIATGKRLADAWIESIGRATLPGGALPVLRACTEDCLTLDENFLDADKRTVLTTANAGAGGLLAWAMDRL